MSTSQTMYEQNVYFPDVFKGCLHNCVYCKPSFQRQAKRQKQRCQKCYTFEPHTHFERLKKRSPGTVYAMGGYIKAPATVGDQFVFFPKGGDPCYASRSELGTMLHYVEKNPQTAFLMQTKNPIFMQGIEEFPSNLIVGITLETNREVFEGFPKFKDYGAISEAPLPRHRAHDFLRVKYEPKFVTVEPILQFDLAVFAYWIMAINPKVVYVGYDTKGCKLPEPTLAETLELIKFLENEGITVRRKTIRKAWYESKHLRDAKRQRKYSPRLCNSISEKGTEQK